MFHTQAVNSKHFTPSLDLKITKNNFKQLEPKPSQSLSSKRSKSTTIRKVPIHQSLPNTNRSVDILNTDPSPKNGSESARIILSRPPSLKGNKKADILIPIEHTNRKPSSLSPEKRRPPPFPEEKNILRSSDSKVKVYNFESLAVPVAQFNLSLKSQESAKPKVSSSYVPTRSISGITLKQGVFNEGLIAAKFNNVKQAALPFKSRKEHSNYNSGEETRPSSKRNAKVVERDIEFSEANHSHNVQETEQEDALFHQIDDRVKAKKSISEVRLPKLEPVHIIKKKSRNDISESIPSVNTSSVSTQITTTNIIQSRKSEKEASPLYNSGNPVSSGNVRRPPRGKVQSFDRNDPTKAKLIKPEILDPTHVLNQQQILIRKRSSDHNKNSPSRISGTDTSERSITPIRLRTQSVTVMNAPTNSSFGLDFLEHNKNVVMNFAFKTRAGALPNKPIKTNQDAYTVYPNFAGSKDKYFFAVSDGHGVNGHLVSNFIKQNLPKYIENNYKALTSHDPSSMKDMLIASFKKTSDELLDSTIDTNFSGSTTVSTLILGSKLWCANVGDSRAVIAKHKNGQWIASPLSNDHKPDTPDELARILEKGGRVDTFRDPYGEKIGPYRVWLKDQNIPGLAMARSFGDGVAASVGVISEPEVIMYDLEEDDKFIIIASDGVWEFLENQQVIDYIVPFFVKNHLESACEKVVRESVIRWKEEDEVIDDITCIIISLKVPK